MINDQTILSSFDDKPTLLEWLKKVEDALKTDTATAVSVENPSANTYVFKITFADGKTLSSGNVVFPDSVKDVSIKNGHIIVTSVGGNVEDLGVLNPYANTIVVNAETDTTEIEGKLQVSGNVATGGNLGVTGQAVVGGRLQVNSSIISNGEIRGGDVSASKFYLGTEEMPLVKANPTGEATATLEKVKIGDVAYKVGATENDRVLKLVMPFASNDSTSNKYAIVEDENVWDKLNNYYYESIILYYNDDYPLGVFNVIDYYQGGFKKKYITMVPKYVGSGGGYNQWFGKTNGSYYSIHLTFNTISGVHKVGYYQSDANTGYVLEQSKFDALYKLADKPTQDGNYILKASVSGGVVTYTWELQQ